MRRYLRDFRTVTTFSRACKAQEAGRFHETLRLLEGFEGDPEYLAKAELFRAMAHHRLLRYAEAVAHYDQFLTSFLSHLPAPDRTYLNEYAKFYRSRAKAKIDPNTSLYSSLEELRILQKSARLLTRNEFAT